MNMDKLKSIIKRPILVTGADGMLGSDLVLTLKDRLGDDWVYGMNSNIVDITNPQSVFRAMTEINPGIVINAAAYTDVDGAEYETNKALAVNVLGPKHLVRACRQSGAKLFHFSTEYVFSGEGNEPWKETDIPFPPEPNRYGQTKMLGEKEVLAWEDSVVLRVQWLYGDKKDRFTTLAEKKTFSPFFDQYGAPQWTLEVCKIVGELLARDAKGIFHFAYDDYASWSEVYEFVKEEMGFSVELSPQAMDTVALPARRPRFGVMSNRKLLDFLGWRTMGSWKDPLRVFLRRKQDQRQSLPLETPLYERVKSLQ